MTQKHDIPEGYKRCSRGDEYTHPLSGKRYLKIGNLSLRRGRLNWGLFCLCWRDKCVLGVDKHSVQWDSPFGKGFIWVIPDMPTLTVLTKFNRRQRTFQPFRRREHLKIKS